MNLAALFGSAFVIGLSGAMMPGPVLTATVSEALKRGVVAGPLIVAGHAVLEFALLLFVIAGLGPWIERDAVQGVLGVLGGATLIVMGANMIRSARAAVEKALAPAAGGARPASVRRPLLMGIVLSLSNPYWAVWWATIGLNLASRALQRGAPGLAAFYSGHISSDLVWYTAVSLAVASGRRICPPAAYRALIAACGAALIGLGAMFLGDGAGRWT
jgi:threonine/homoserine/homoserine lactone efflux protein